MGDKVGVEFLEEWCGNLENHLLDIEKRFEALEDNTKGYDAPLDKGNDTITVGCDKGKKFDADKPRFDLIPVGVMDEIVRVLTFGNHKYDEDYKPEPNWQKVPHLKARYYAASQRHSVTEWHDRGVKKDEESGLHPLAHAITCLMFILSKELKEKQEAEGVCDKRLVEARDDSKEVEPGFNTHTECDLVKVRVPYETYLPQMSLSDMVLKQHTKAILGLDFYNDIILKQCAEAALGQDKQQKTEE